MIEGVPVQVDNGSRENARAWFLYSEQDPADASLSQSGQPMQYIGLDESLAIVQGELDSAGEDFVAVMGFSQGGVFCHILSRLGETTQAFGRIRAVIVASGFAAQHVSDESSPYQQCGRMPDRVTISLPSLHLIGEKDTSVDPDLSKDLASIYIDCEFLYHEKGHILPQKSADCRKMIDFLDKISEASN
jgi:predicted esterase